MRRQVIARYITYILLVMLLVDTPLNVCAYSSQDYDKNSARVNRAIEDTTSKNEIIEIGTITEFEAFIENCKLDSFSTGKCFKLTKDLNITKDNIDAIPYFNGTFDGDNHTLTFGAVTYTGTDYGLFRYVGSNAVVKNLNVTGYITGAGSSKNIGGIVGVNFGTITNCSFTGIISGTDNVGGIVGLNKSSGQIGSCKVNADISATNNTGGIAGVNEGRIVCCFNYGSVNKDELEARIDVGAVDLGSLNITKTVMNRNNMGGIAGSSSGIIIQCKNSGVIGYNHTGYNVGGIAGRQSGVITACVNEGQVYGRKDIGGIVGQAEPYVESEYLSGKVSEAQDNVNAVAKSVGGIGTAISDSYNESSKKLKDMTDQYTKDVDTLKESLEDISSSISSNDPEAKKYIEEINAAIADLEEISSKRELIKDYTFEDLKKADYEEIRKKLEEEEDKAKQEADKAKKEADKVKKESEKVSESVNSIKKMIDEKTLKDIQDDISIINKDLFILQNQYSVSINNAEDAVSNFVEEVKNTDGAKNIGEFVGVLDNGFTNVMDSFHSFNGEVNSIIDDVNKSIEAMEKKDGYSYINDISTSDIKDKKGVIYGCVNNASVEGDINIGGIAGNMSIEYENDPELDIDFKTSLDITLRISVNDVIIRCQNNAKVKSRRDCAGSIAGIQEFGLIYRCEGYGRVTTDGGDYIGGIAGSSKGSILNCYSYAILNGSAYVGGIAGYGDSLENNISLSIINASGECKGSIAGQILGDGTVDNNYFDNSDVEGIDGITYAGKADRRSYEEIMAMDDVPNKFNKVIVVFEVEDEELASVTIPYGTSIGVEDYPEVPYKEGYYVQWDMSKNTDNIEKNMTINASYILWDQSIAGYTRNDNDKIILVVEGQFYQDARLLMHSVDGPDNLANNQEVKYSYGWYIDNNRDIKYDKVSARFYAGKNPKNYSIMINQDGKWKKVDSKIDGSYLVAKIPYGKDFAVVYTKPDYTVYIVGASGLVILLLIVVMVIRRSRRKAKQK